MALFKEGEVVILQSKSQPESNGEYTVTKVIESSGEIFCRVQEVSYLWNPLGLVSGPVYILDGCIALHPETMDREVPWAESALRKKHQKGDMNYKELMSTLKNPVMEWN